MIVRSAVRLGLAALAVFVLLPASILGLAALTGLRTGLVQPEFFLLLGAAVVLACAAVAWATGSPVLARRLAASASLAALLIAAKAALPGIAARLTGEARRLNHRAQVSELVAATPAVIACTEPYFIGPDGVNRYWFSYDDEHPRCYDRAGRDPRTGRVLQPVDRVVADYIRVRAANAELEAKLARSVRQTTERIASVPAAPPAPSPAPEPPAVVAAQTVPAEPPPAAPEWTAPRVPDRLPQEPPR